MAVRSYSMANKSGSSRADYYDSKTDRNSSSYINFSGSSKAPTNFSGISVGSSGSSSGSKGSGGSSGSGTSMSSAGSGYSGTDYASKLAEMYAQQQAQAQAYAAQQRAAAESAYRAGMERLGQAWNTKTGALRDNLNSTLANLQRQYDSSKNEVNADANKSLREAYINYMLNKKNLNQNLTAQGIGGGAAESTMAGMYNNYGNSRNNINTTLNDNLTSLENTYQGNISNANQQYNSAYANALSDYLNYQNQLEQNLASNIVGSYGNMVSALGSLDSGYTNALYDLLQKQAAYEYQNTKNTLGIDKVSTDALNNMGSVTDWAKYQAMIQQMQNSGQSNAQIIQSLMNSGVDRNTAYKLFGV